MRSQPLNRWKSRQYIGPLTIKSHVSTHLRKWHLPFAGLLFTFLFDSIAENLHIHGNHMSYNSSPLNPIGFDQTRFTATEIITHKLKYALTTIGCYRYKSKPIMPNI
jgi:hypothetical protein